MSEREGEKKKKRNASRKIGYMPVIALRLEGMEAKTKRETDRIRVTRYVRIERRIVRVRFAPAARTLEG